MEPFKTKRKKDDFCHALEGWAFSQLASPPNKTKTDPVTNGIGFLVFFSGGMFVYARNPAP